MHYVSWRKGKFPALCEMASYIGDNADVEKRDCASEGCVCVCELCDEHVGGLRKAKKCQRHFNMQVTLRAMR